MTSAVTQGKSGRSRVEETCCQPHRTAGFSVLWARRNPCDALQTGGATARLRRYAVRHGACASVRCESCHRVSSLFGQPNLRCPRAGDTGGDVGAVRDRWSMLPPAKSVWRHRLASRGAWSICGCAGDTHRCGRSGSAPRSAHHLAHPALTLTSASLSPSGICRSVKAIQRSIGSSSAFRPDSTAMCRWLIRIGPGRLFCFSVGQRSTRRYRRGSPGGAAGICIRTSSVPFRPWSVPGPPCSADTDFRFPRPPLTSAEPHSGSCPPDPARSTGNHTALWISICPFERKLR